MKKRTPNDTLRILAQDILVCNDTRVSGTNNNDLIIGPSGAGKTRGYVKPNLLQCALQGGESLIIADTKGSLIEEVGPVMAVHGYRVINLDFTELLKNRWGYNPLRYIAYDREQDKYSEQDINQIAACLNPVEKSSDPFWDQSAQLYLAALIAYVMEAQPKEEHSLTTVARLYREMEEEDFPRRFQVLAARDPNSYAAQLYAMVSEGKKADKTYTSIKMMIARNLGPLTYDGPRHLYQLKNQIDFRRLGREKTALFLTISDTDRSMDKLTNLFYAQALQTLCESADKDYPDHRLPVPVRFILDDFATNAVIPDFDKTISVIRSREISVSLIIQSINQLYSLYGQDKGKTIINNCDNCLYLGGQDVDTSQFISIKANKPQNVILNMPLDHVWLFTRGQMPREVQKYDLRRHPLYGELPEAGGTPPPIPMPEEESAPAAPVPPEEAPAAVDAGGPEEDWEILEEDGEIPEEDQAGPNAGRFRTLSERRRQMVGKALRLDEILSGRDGALSPFLQDGQYYCAKRAADLVDRLLSSAADYCRFEKRPELTENDRTCLRSFFYCALHLAYSRPCWLPEVRGTFQDVVDFVRNLHYTRRVDLLFNERYRTLGVGSNFFEWMDEACYRLTGLYAAAYITPAEEQTLQECYWEEIQAIQEMQQEAEENSPFAGWTQEEIDRYNDYQEEQLCASDPEYAREKEEGQRWKDAFPERGVFCQHYLMLRKLYFDSAIRDAMPGIVESAVNLLLEERSLYWDEEKCAKALQALDLAVEALKEDGGDTDANG